MAKKTAPIEPQWAGRERSLGNVLQWTIILFLVVPMLLALAYGIIAKLIGLPVLLGVMYGLGILTGTIPLLRYVHEKGRLYIQVPSQSVVIVTRDLPAAQVREASDAREETIPEAVKLAEGIHFLGIFDQIYATVPIEATYSAKINKQRISLGSTVSKDIVVNSAEAIFKTSPEKTFALVRISRDDKLRKERIESNMSAYLTRFVENECKSMFRDEKRDPGEFSDIISERVSKRIERMLESESWGIYLKSFTLGDIDDPKDVNDARDKAASMDHYKNLAKVLMNELNEGLAKDSSHRLTPEQALDQVLVGVGIKEVKRTESYKQIDPNTLNTIGEILARILSAWKP